VALIGHLRVANECRAASATLTAASSGPIPKAPGSAGGYLHMGHRSQPKVELFLSKPSINAGALPIAISLEERQTARYAWVAFNGAAA